MLRLIVRATVVMGSAALVGAMHAPTALAAPAPVDPEQPRGNPVAAGKADSDADRIGDDLEAALVGLEPGDRVDVIVRGATPSQAVRAAPSFKASRTYTIIPAFAGSVTAGQVGALAGIRWVARVELDGVSVALDSAGDRDYGVASARAAGFAADGALDGDGVGICIVDTGIDPGHEQLSGRVDGWIDFVNGRSSAYDDHGHGTHVAGIAAGDGTGSSAAGTYGGVARSARLIGAKVLDAQGSGADSDVAAAIDWCALRPDVDVISMSLGSPAGDGSDAVSQAADSAAANHGKVVVVAAGNDGDGEGTIATPGVASQVVTVGAASDFSVPAGQPGHDAGLTIAGFSSRGPSGNPGARLKPDVVAPGVTVMAAQAGTTSSYVSYSGTSMATPFVAGVVALGLEAQPQATPADVKAALHASARDAGAGGPDNDWGFGLVDAQAFIRQLRGDTSVTPSTGPEHSLVSGTVADDGTASIPIVVTTAGQPLGISLRLDGSQGCLLPVGGECWWPGEWEPDLDAVLLNPSGQQVAQSQCPLSTTTGYCGTVGRWETLGVAAADAGTWTLRVQPFSGTGGTFEADVFGALSGGAPPNTPPVADAGGDLDVPSGTSVTLQGGGSDGDGDLLTWAWKQITGPTVALSGADTPSPTFTAPAGESALVFRLTVEDGRGGSDSDDVSVLVHSNTAPVAEAGDDLDVSRSARFTLDGSKSLDPDGDTLTYAWYAVKGGKLLGRTPTLTQRVTKAGTYEYRLTVTDPSGASDSDTVLVRVT